MSKTGGGSCWGEADRLSLAPEWAPQPWVNATTLPSSLAMPLAQTPNVSDERSGEADEEAAGIAAVGRLLGERRVRALLAVVPPLGGQVAPLEGEHPLASEPDLSREGAVEGVHVVAGRPRGHESRVVLLGREHVAWAEVAGLDALLVRRPRRRDDRLVAGEQHDLVDGDLLGVGRAGDGHRPVPAAVAGLRAREVVRDETVALLDRAQVIAHRSGVGSLVRGVAGDVDGRDQQRVGGHVLIVAHGSACSVPGVRQDEAMEENERFASALHPSPKPNGPLASRGRDAFSEGVGRLVARGSSSAFLGARRFTQSGGAGESGLSRLLELHAFNTAGDAAVAVSLAGTLFFTVPTEQASSQVALFLVLTMLPFAVVAPLIGPFLDRFRRGRRWAIGATLAVRAFCCWVLAGAVVDESASFYLAALGVLISSKAYGVTRAAAVPRLLPSEFTLVKANSRISLTGTAAAVISAPLAVGAAAIGAPWALRYAAVLFVIGTIFAILLPDRVDSSAGEETVSIAGRRHGIAVSRDVVNGLRSNAGLRLLTGFLTIFMAFVLREPPDSMGWGGNATILMALVIGAAGLGNTLGIVIGSWAKSHRPERVVLAVLVLDVVGARRGGGVLQVADRGRPRSHGGAVPVAGQAEPRRPHPARRRRGGPHQHVRPFGDAASALVGDRRADRHRTVHGRRLGTRWAWSSPR